MLANVGAIKRNPAEQESKSSRKPTTKSRKWRRKWNTCT